ncbi:MAG TPA: hypothetical protein VGO47_02270 [Chlamydiales bacterium]|jgi:hypothetical protein|nr:hypothetical protein [Chlamydiales bacterium]
MINWQPFSIDDSTAFEWAYLSPFSTDVVIPKVEEIDTLRVVVFKDENVLIKYAQGTSFVYKKYTIESGASDERRQFVDTSVDIFKGGLGVKAKKLQIFIQGNYWFQAYVPLAGRVHQQLRDFILQGPSTSAFCCVDFVQKLFDKYVPQCPHTFDKKEWKFFRCTRKQLPKAGDAIALAAEQSKELLRHFAFCLGQGLYLSVAGDNGPLVVTELEELKNLYRARTVFVISPRKGTQG